MSFRFTSILLALLAINGLVITAAWGQSDCGCGPAAIKGYSLDHYGGSACGHQRGHGCGPGHTLFGRLRHHANCDPALREGLWDGYCEERIACDRSHAGHMLGGHVARGHLGGGGMIGGGLGRTGCGISGWGGGCGCGMAGCNCGPSACGTSGGGCRSGLGGRSHGCGSCQSFGGNRCGCGTVFGTHRSASAARHGGCDHGHVSRVFRLPRAAGWGGCDAGLLGRGTDCHAGAHAPDIATLAVEALNCCGEVASRGGCFRNDGHFFGCFSRSRQGVGHQSRGANHCHQCSLFSRLQPPQTGCGCNFFGRGHCGKAADMTSYVLDCGCAGAVESGFASQPIPNASENH